MPEAGHHHVLYRASFPVGEFYFDFLRARNCLGWRFRRNGRTEGSRRLGFLRLWLHRLAVPLWIAEVQVRSHEIVDREVIFAVIEARASADDLLEFDHRTDG